MQIAMLRHVLKDAVWQAWVVTALASITSIMFHTWRLNFVWVAHTIWPSFHFYDIVQVADSLEKGTEHEDEYMISEKELLVNRWLLLPIGVRLSIHV